MRRGRRGGWILSQTLCPRLGRGLNLLVDAVHFSSEQRRSIFPSRQPRCEVSALQKTGPRAPSEDIRKGTGERPGFSWSHHMALISGHTYPMLWGNPDINDEARYQELPSEPQVKMGLLHLSCHRWDR